MTSAGVFGLLEKTEVLAIVLGRSVTPDLGQLTALAPNDLDRLAYFHTAMSGEAPKDGTAFGIPVPDLPLATLIHAAREIMALWGQADPAALFARREMILVRAASRMRAEEDPAPAVLRHFAQESDVSEVALRQPYAQFFAVEERKIGWRRFDGGHYSPILRAAFVSGDAVTVLPYDPVRDRVLVVEQFRAGPHARGDRQPWQIEAIAGRIDPGETPADAARREAMEEAGVHLGALHKVADYYPSPGILTEYLYSFVAIADLPDAAAGIFGLESEQEDIRGHCLSLERLMHLVASGEVANAPLILTALWLQRERGTLRVGGAK